MILLYDKTFDDLVKETEIELSSNGFSITPGAVAKLFLNIINKRQANFYDILRINHMQAFLSSSSGNFIDKIGFLLNCIRESGEEDDDYKYRISNQVLSLANANETAIRLAALSVSGVSDIKIEKYSYGSGSFSIFVLTDDVLASDSILKNVKDAVGKVVSFGMKYDVLNPKIIEVSLKIKLMLNSYLTDSKAQEIKIAARENIKKYLISRNIGVPIIANELSKIIMSISSDVIDFSVSEFKINNKPINFKDQIARKDERFMLTSNGDGLILT